MCEDWLFASMGLPVNGSSDIAGFFTPDNLVYIHALNGICALYSLYLYIFVAR